MKRPSKEQEDIILAFMAANPALARGAVACTSDGKAKQTRLWKELTLSLNSVNGCHKDVTNWRKYWSDKKRNTRKKQSSQRTEWKKTGGGQAETFYFTETENRVISLLGEEDGDRLEGVAVEAFPQDHNYNSVPSSTIDKELHLPSTSQDMDTEEVLEEIEFPFSENSGAPEDSQATYIVETSEQTSEQDMAQKTKKKSKCAGKENLLKGKSTLEKKMYSFKKLEEQRNKSEDKIVEALQDMTNTMKSNFESNNRLMQAQTDPVSLQRNLLSAHKFSCQFK